MLSEITNHQINILATVPNNLQMLLDPHVVSRGNVESLKFLFVAGSRFSTGLYEILDAYKDQIAVYNCYGPTEATIYCVFSHLFQAAHDLNSKCVTIGKALPGCQAEIISPEGQPVVQGERGELVIGGHQLMDGYRNRADLTEAAFVELSGVRFYKTGDVCFRDEQGQYFVVGRIDDTIKTAGFRVNLSNIDSYISQLEAVQASGTIAVAHPQKENILVSYIVANPGATDASIRADLQKVLNPYQVPSKIILVENLPVTTSGKIAKRELLARYEDAQAS
jgi:acyl-coenzyme A synthetase/AMP-(fatty) acid ligase